MQMFWMMINNNVELGSMDLDYRPQVYLQECEVVSQCISDPMGPEIVTSLGGILTSTQFVFTAHHFLHTHVALISSSQLQWSHSCHRLYLGPSRILIVCVHLNSYLCTSHIQLGTSHIVQYMLGVVSVDEQLMTERRKESL